MTLSDETPKAFTGHSRQRQTRQAVKVAEVVARTLISIGGIGTIVAVATVCVFLVRVAIPLFTPAHSTPSHDVRMTADLADRRIVRAGADEYGVLLWVAWSDGAIAAYGADTGEILGVPQQPFGQAPSAWSFSPDGDDVCVGFGDGTVRMGSVGVAIEFLGDNQVPEAVRAVPIGERTRFGDCIFVHTRPGQFRRHTLRAEARPPLKIGDEPVRLVAHTLRNDGSVVAALAGDTLTLNTVTEIRNFLTGEATPQAQRTDVPYPVTREHGMPLYLFLSRLGDQMYMAWEDGYLRRYDTRDRTKPVLAEETRLVDGAETRLTVMGMLLGRTTLFTGDSSGRLRCWFNVRDEKSPDGLRFLPTREFSEFDHPIRAAAAAPRARLLAAGDETGRVRLFQVTAVAQIAEVQMDEGEKVAVEAVVIGARGDRLYAFSGGRARSWMTVDPHPEITWAMLFRPVWYEGFDRPLHMWQSSAGVDSFEPKYGLWPLIFGTLKATFYSMLFGLPIALLAAIYTSEFLHPRVKTRVKPLIEMMASLPSVVLGFLSALVVAPWVEGRVPHLLTVMAAVPVTFLAGAYLWQLWPNEWAMRLRAVRAWTMVAALPLACAWAWRLGPRVERWLFAGDLMRWLDGQIGNGTGGWFVLFLPLTGVAVAYAMHTLSNTFFRARARSWSPTSVALADLGRFVGGLLLTIGLTWLIARVLVFLGFDPRGREVWHFMGTYVQRNALVVGFIMGFAVIPIIYTISEDALSAVPEHLRSASLGAGATPWQTAARIIIPTAMSGLFSATMIGLGRAVGETMIVLMAAGNTPVMQMNIFNGFRTLAANIAVELPEAPVNGTHYRVLFFTALVLFVMTFVLNTAAERVRQKFRKRAYKL